MRALAPILCCALAACKPPAAEDYVARVGLQTRAAPSQPIDSPDTEGAVWAPAAETGRLLYGKPGEHPLFALACKDGEAGPVVDYTRFARADAHAKAILALVGNGHVAHLKIDAKQRGDAWLWEGSAPADSPDLEALTGHRQVEATIPGAGSVILNSSARPGELIERCRRLSREASPAGQDPRASMP